MNEAAQRVLAAARSYHHEGGPVKLLLLDDAVADLETVAAESAIHHPAHDVWAQHASGAPGTTVAVDRSNCIVVHTPHGETFTITDVSKFVESLQSAVAARDRREGRGK